MLKAIDIKEAVFAKSMSGYKQDEVDALLDKVYEDYVQFETVAAALQTRISSLEKELEEKETSANSINTVLISAQKLADSIVEDAKKKADETIENANTEAENIKFRTKKALEEIDAVLTEQKNKAQAEVDLMLEDAARKSEGMILAAKDSVTREQLLFDKLKSEVAEFKKSIKDTYKAHLESLSKLPDEVTLNPELAASTIEEIINNEPDLLKFIEKTPVAQVVEVEEIIEEETTEEEIIEEVIEASEEDDTVVYEAPTGFTVQVEENEEDEEPNFASSFFTKNL
ncbi:MAG: DivIVA domain-containing protein [Clostridia bacterium]|nr:DivIVA domain-containing protein [Clostridia bacterium]